MKENEVPLKVIWCEEAQWLEEARLAGISPASASGHITALRAAGLTATMRDGARARHRRTSLGTLPAG